MAEATQRSVFVTGAAGGLGFGISKAFAEAGYRVGLLDANGPLLDEAMAQLSAYQCEAYVADVSDRAAVGRAVDGFARTAGGLDAVVNNAVYFHYAPLVDMEEAVISRMLDVGLKGAFWTLQAATPHLIARGGGVVINLSSIATVTAIRNAAVYSSIKGAIDTLTRQQAGELAQYAIRVNALAPGPVVTPGTRSVIDEEGWEKRRNSTPLKRLASAEEIGAAAVFLASDAAKSITGVTLKIDAGVTTGGF